MKYIFNKITSLCLGISKSLLSLSGIRLSFRKIAFIYKIKQDLSDNNSNKEYVHNDNIHLTQEDKKKWLAYSKDMLQKSHHALLYLTLIFLWTAANIAFMLKKAPFWLFLLQFYFLAILSYYFIMCRYRSYQGEKYANMLKPLSFKQWFYKIFNKKI